MVLTRGLTLVGPFSFLMTMLISNFYQRITDPVKCSVILWAKRSHSSHLQHVCVWFKSKFWCKYSLLIGIVGTNLCLCIRHKGAQNLAVHCPTTCDLQINIDHQSFHPEEVVYFIQRFKSQTLNHKWRVLFIVLIISCQTFFGWSSTLPSGGGAPFTEQNANV